MAKLIGAIVIIAVVLGVGYAVLGKKEEAAGTKAMAPVAKDTAAPKGAVKEFSTTAYFDDAGVWYSLKEMRVKQGDTVRVKATNTKGMHDFVIDELGVKKELPLNEEVVIEFVADKKGEFAFYCSKPGHRAKGQWGTLFVE